MRLARNLAIGAILVGALAFSCGSSDDDDGTPAYTVPEALSGFCQYSESESVCTNYTGEGEFSTDLAEDCRAENGGALAVGVWNTAGACSSANLIAYCIVDKDLDTEFYKYYYESDSSDV